MQSLPHLSVCTEWLSSVSSMSLSASREHGVMKACGIAHHVSLTPKGHLLITVSRENAAGEVTVSCS
jgi:hypothetical protein